MQRSHPTFAFKLLTLLPTTLYLLPLLPFHFLMFWLFSYTSCFLFLPDSLRVFQWNAGGLQASSTELLHFISIQESNFNLSYSFRILGFSTLRSDRTHSRSGIFSPDEPLASGGVIIFVRKKLSFSKFSTSSLLRFTPTLIK